MGTSEIKSENLKVLLVEDDEDIARIIATFLASGGVDVTCVHDGESGWNAMRQQRPDLLICDLMIPHTSGAELIAKVRADSSLAQTPVVAISAGMASDDQAAEMCKVLDVDAAFAKPLSLKKVLQTVIELATAVRPG